MTITASPDTLRAFWDRVRANLPTVPVEVPEAWAFGATPEHADSLLELVLTGVKTGTASAVWDYETDGDPMPEAGDLSILLDGRGTPRAVIQTTSVTVVPFDRVTEEHAQAEGEGRRTLRDWREIHERFWREHSTRGFAPDMPVLCERFAVLWSDVAAGDA